MTNLLIFAKFLANAADVLVVCVYFMWIVRVEAYAHFHTIEDAFKCIGSSIWLRNCCITSRLAEGLSVDTDALSMMMQFELLTVSYRHIAVAVLPCWAGENTFGNCFM